MDNYLPGNVAPYVASDNRWGANQAVEKMLAEGHRRILFLGGHSAVAALQDRHAGYCGALEDAGLKHERSLIVWRDSRDAVALKTVLSHFQGTDPPDAICVTSYFLLFPLLTLLDELGLCHPHDELLAGFDEPMETWAVEVVRHVIRGPLRGVQQATAEIGHVAVDLAHAAAQGTDISKQRRLIRPLLSWPQDD